MSFKVKVCECGGIPEFQEDSVGVVVLACPVCESQSSLCITKKEAVREWNFGTDTRKYTTIEGKAKL